MREIVVALEAALPQARATQRLLGRRASLRALWRLTALLLPPCRFGGTALYAYSVLRWRDALDALPAEARAVYHAASVGFSALSLGWVGLLLLQADADLGLGSSAATRAAAVEVVEEEAAVKAAVGMGW